MGERICVATWIVATPVFTANRSKTCRALIFRIPPLGSGNSMSCGVVHCSADRHRLLGQGEGDFAFAAGRGLDRKPLPVHDLALGVQRDDRQRHADRLGQVLEAVRRHQVGAAVVMDLVACR